MDYSIIVFDTAPTGHTLRLLQFPSTLEKGLGQLMSLKSKFGGMLGQVCSYYGKSFVYLSNYLPGTSHDACNIYVCIYRLMFVIYIYRLMFVNKLFHPTNLHAMNSSSPTFLLISMFFRLLWNPSLSLSLSNNCTGKKMVLVFIAYDAYKTTLL